MVQSQFSRHSGLSSLDANNHQQTYGVVGAAISVLRYYMERNGYCVASFDIFDGENQVGAGQILDV